MLILNIFLVIIGSTVADYVSNAKTKLNCPIFARNRTQIPCQCYRYYDVTYGITESVIDCSTLKTIPNDLVSNISWTKYVQIGQQNFTLGGHALKGLNSTLLTFDFTNSSVNTLVRADLDKSQPQMKTLIMDGTNYYPYYNSIFFSNAIMRKLTTLSLSRIRYTSCSGLRAYHQYPALQSLDMSQGRSSYYINANCFFYLRNLPVKNLSFANTRVDVLTSYHLKYVTKIEHLDISYTKTKFMPSFNYNRKAKSLSIGGNPFAAIYQHHLYNNTKLERLFLKDNDIYDIDRRAFCRFNLTHFHFTSKNGLHFDACLLHTSLKELILHDVTVTCNCNFFALRSVLFSNNASIESNAQCGRGSSTAFVGREAFNDISQKEVEKECANRNGSCAHQCLPKQLPEVFQCNLSRHSPHKLRVCPKDEYGIPIDCLCYYDVIKQLNILNCTKTKRLAQMSSSVEWNVYIHRQGNLTNEKLAQQPFHRLPKKIRHVDLSQNRINGYSSEFLRPLEKSVVTFNLSNNLFDSLPYMPSQSSLRNLSIASNIIKRCWDTSQNLFRFLDVSQQQNGYFDTRCLLYQSELKEFIASNNRLDWSPLGFVRTLSTLSALNILRVANTSLSAVASDTFSRVKNLYHLDISNNILSQVDRYSISQLSNLKTLMMQNVDPQTLHELAFCNSSLNTLDLTQQSPKRLNICSLDPVKYSLAELHLTNVAITCDCAFFGLRNIWKQKGVVKGESPRCNDLSLARLIGQYAMNISDTLYNRLCPKAISCGVICDKEPRDIKKNVGCPKTDKKNACHCYNLNNISTIDCSLEKELLHFYTNDTWLTYIHLYSGKSRFPRLCHDLIHVEHLDLSHNSLYTTGMNISNCKHLKKLNVSHNQISSLNTFAHPILETLILRSNYLNDGVLENKLRKTPNLRYLDISHSKREITKVHKFIFCRKLEVLKMEILKIQEVGEHAFREYPSIREISLANNTGLILRKLSFCDIGHTLETLNLDFTETHIDLCVLSRFKKLRHLYLRDVSTDCGCDFLDARSKVGHFVNGSRPGVVCSTPPRFQNRMAFLISDKEAKTYCPKGSYYPCPDYCLMDKPTRAPTTHAPNMAGPIAGVVVSFLVVIVVSFLLGAMFMRRRSTNHQAESERTSPLPPAYDIETVNTSGVTAATSAPDSARAATVAETSFSSECFDKANLPSYEQMEHARATDEQPPNNLST